MMPLCSGIGCPLKNSCAHYAETIHEDDMAFTHAPYSTFKKSCEFYTGLDVDALRNHIKDILNDNKTNL
jgi:hypothetical protein